MNSKQYNTYYTYANKKLLCNQKLNFGRIFFFNYVFTLCADLRLYSMRLRRFTFLLQLPTDVSVT